MQVGVWALRAFRRVGDLQESAEDDVMLAVSEGKAMSKDIQPFEATRIPNDPLDAVKVGDWYWVKFDDEKWDDKKGKHVKVGEHEDLMCVEEVGSNYVGFSVYEKDSHHTSDERVHFNEFLDRCRPEPDWKAVLNVRMEGFQKQIAAKTREMVERAKELCLLKAPRQEKAEEGSLLPVRSSVDLRAHQKELVKYQKSVPEISKEIDELAKEFGAAARNMALPDMAQLGVVKGSIKVVEDRIFTIELYVGLKENVVCIADGEPADADEPVAVRQLMLYMDEETLFDYEDGGMDFNKLDDFDKWVVKPANLCRVLPEKRGVVAFQVRRHKKDYGTPSNLLEAWTHLHWEQANMVTYLLIRNGQRVYRVASDIDFAPRLIPTADEIAKEPFEEVDRWSEKKEAKVVTPESVRYDDHVREMMNRIQHYNRVVVLLQGLLDRTDVFAPHPPIRLSKSVDMEKWVRLIRDEEKGLSGLKVTLEEYLGQLNKTLRTGKWVYVLPQYRRAEREGKYSNKHYARLHGKSVEIVRPQRGYMSADMPAVCKVQAMKRDGSAVKVSWPKGKNSHWKRTWVPNPKRPGWGHYDHDDSTDMMLHEWVPVAFVMNLSDYTAGDYKMFLCDRALRGEYLEWAPPLLTAEDWARDRANGSSPEQCGRMEKK